MIKKVIVLFCFLLMQIISFAQCAMCTKTAAGLDAKSAEGINSAIIYLAFIPLLILGAIFYYMFKMYKSKESN